MQIRGGGGGAAKGTARAAGADASADASSGGPGGDLAEERAEEGEEDDDDDVEVDDVGEDGAVMDNGTEEAAQSEIVEDDAEESEAVEEIEVSEEIEVEIEMDEEPHHQQQQQQQQQQEQRGDDVRAAEQGDDEEEDEDEDARTTEVYYNGKEDDGGDDDDDDDEEGDDVDSKPKHASELRGDDAEMDDDADADVEAEAGYEDEDDPASAAAAAFSSPNTDDSDNYEGEEQEQDETIDSDDPAAIRRSAAAELRVLGKELHDTGELERAADTFRQAADELDGAIEILATLSSESSAAASESAPASDTGEQQQQQQQQQQTDATTLAEMIEEGATCRLHEALCHLKRKEYALCVQSCTGVLDDGVQIVPLAESYKEDDVTEDDGSEVDEDEDHDRPKRTPGGGARKAAVVRIAPTGGAHGAGAVGMMKGTTLHQVSPAARARAYHRRAKARLALGDAAGALEDARSAAFLGDRNAVALYGRLMREASSGPAGSGDNGGTDGGGGMLSQGNGASSPSSQMLSDLLGGKNPFDLLGAGAPGAAGGDGGSSGAAALFESLLKSSGSGGTAGGAGSGSSPLGPLGDLSSMLAGAGADNDDNKKRRRRRGRKAKDKNGGGLDGLAKSVLKNLVKRIEDEPTQERICKYLNAADANQVMTYASMAGVPLSRASAENIVKFANGVTPRGIARSVKLTKRAVSAVTITRKVSKVISKYRHWLVLLLIVGWVKSSVLRPPPVDTRAVKKAAKRAAAEAASAAAATAQGGSGITVTATKSAAFSILIGLLLGIFAAYVLPM